MSDKNSIKRSRKKKSRTSIVIEDNLSSKNKTQKKKRGIRWKKTGEKRLGKREKRVS